MIGWARSRWEGWRTRSRHSQVEASIRWSLIPLPWFLPLVGLTLLPSEATDSPTAATLVWAVIGVNVLMSATSSFAVDRALDAYVGLRPVSWPSVAVLAVQLAAATALTVTLVATGGLSEDSVEGMLLLAPTGAFLLPYGLLAKARTVALTLAGIIAVAVVAFGFAGMDGGELTGLAIAVAIGGFAMAFSSRCSGWYVAVMRELDDAREIQSRLAVAEERLRFGRDLHDVLGRNLSVIALKSELAVQLALRGGEPETAISQMVEVQRIAQDSQREVREVVRGYREADLATELAGARSVLRAAGIDCRAAGDGGGSRLPEPVRAALGWVVREGTTNVLRHSDATRCVITVHRRGADAVLIMENDGATGAADCDGEGDERAGGGAGLAGLRERLAALRGTLTTDRPATAAFRLTARIPLDGAVVADDGARDGTAAGRSPHTAGKPAGRSRATDTSRAAAPGRIRAAVPERPADDGAVGASATGVAGAGHSGKAAR